ncbi:hypothetical protein IMZ31_20015 (plasmid) [Pontibacillus sp. ALD_SL1]|uniref:hypothetical protein n=1 Tax=Pontibacillus sp. ALD_SL1 TaxID=2777185 RepID=UPI001A9690A2|nr:hypothetical protein [Pontibacillus sp. ALD_SL1]QST02838.1 hypothetical protein IMZ31_20015 [Pontibacillus sp. ALD_SL1]
MINVDRSELKKVLAVFKRATKKGMMVLEVTSDGVLHLEIQNDESTCTLSTNLPVNGSDPFHITADPRTLYKWAEKKGEEEEQDTFGFSLGKHALMCETGVYKGKTTPVEFRDEPTIGYHADTAPLKDPGLFLSLLKDASRMLKKHPNPHVSYLKVTNEKGMIVEPQHMLVVRLVEEFPFQGTHIHKDVVGILSTSLTLSATIGIDRDYVILKDKGIYYRLKKRDKVPYQSLRKLQKEQDGYAFTIDADLVKKETKPYTKDCPDLLITRDGDELVVDPRDEEYPVLRFPVTWEHGELHKALFEKETFINLFHAFDGQVTVTEKPFRNIYEAKGYLWEIYTPQKSAMITGITEPDYERIQEEYEANNKMIRR